MSTVTPTTPRIGASPAYKVKDMSLVSTTIKTPDNQSIILPNNSIWGGTITNATASSTRRVLGRQPQSFVV